MMAIEISHGVFKAAEELVKNNDVVSLFGTPLRITLTDNVSCPGYFVRNRGGQLRLVTRRGDRANFEEIPFSDIAGIKPLSANDPFREKNENKLECMLSELLPQMFS